MYTAARLVAPWYVGTTRCTLPAASSCSVCFSHEGRGTVADHSAEEGRLLSDVKYSRCSQKPRSPHLSSHHGFRRSRNIAIPDGSHALCTSANRDWICVGILDRPVPREASMRTSIPAHHKKQKRNEIVSHEERKPPYPVASIPNRIVDIRFLVRIVAWLHNRLAKRTPCPSGIVAHAWTAQNGDMPRLATSQLANALQHTPNPASERPVTYSIQVRADRALRSLIRHCQGERREKSRLVGTRLLLLCTKT